MHLPATEVDRPKTTMAGVGLSRTVGIGRKVHGRTLGARYVLLQREKRRLPLRDCAEPYDAPPQERHDSLQCQVGRLPHPPRSHLGFTG